MPQSATAAERLAVIDIGSNTAALAVYAVTSAGSVDRIAERSEPLRLIRRIGADGRLPGAVMDRTVEVLGSFAGVAREHGAEVVDVVATSAVRDARNADELARRLRSAHGLRMRVLDGAAEGVAAACGTVNTLPLVDGFMLDLGGGSLQIVEIRDRVCARRVSLPLGALRLTDAFRTDGVPSHVEVTALRRHIQEQLRLVPWFRSSPGTTLVGVGGSIRAVAKTERRASLWPVSHGHGYLLTMDAVEAAWERFSRLDPARRRETPGLSAHRVDTIVAGTCVVFHALRASGFDAIRTSSYGVREGVALQRVLGAEAPLVPCPRAAGLRGRFPATAEEHAHADDVAGASTVLFEALAADGSVPAEHIDAVRAAAHLSALPVPTSGPDRIEVLLAAPFQGYWQEQTLAVADLLASVPRFGMDPSVHRRLRSLVEVAGNAEGAEVSARVSGERVVVGGLRWGSGAERRFEAAFGRKLRRP
jgi:exopolyphosphatase/guanosine-5'-triphosphate,3'-diphosphate pyrophosphatase